MSNLRADISISSTATSAGPTRVRTNRSASAAKAPRVGTRLEAWREPHGLEGGEDNASTPVVKKRGQLGARSWAAKCRTAWWRALG